MYGASPEGRRTPAGWFVAGSLVLVGVLPARGQAPFTEEALARGLDYVTTQGGGNQEYGLGVGFADLDGDGDQDVVVVGSAPCHVGVFENDGAGNFIDRTGTTDIPAIEKASGVSFGDYDADGDLDIYLTAWLAPNVLAENIGGFKFKDMSGDARVDDAGAGSGASWADYNGDGLLDIYLTNRTGTIGLAPEPNRLYLNLGNKTFVDVGGHHDVDGEINASFQGVFFDFDKDLDLDLYLSNDHGYSPHWSNRLWRNDLGFYTEISQGSGADVGINSMGVTVGDFNGDLWPDIYCTNTEEGNALLLNQGGGGFVDGTAFAGVASNLIGWGALFLDWDNDGHQELYVCNMNGPNRLYDHDGSYPCVDLAPATGVADAGASFGLAHADIDGDGDLDLLVQNYGQQVRLYVNHEGERRSSSRWRLAGTARNRFGVGARVDLLAGGAWQSQQLVAGQSYKSQSEAMVHFGIGDATRVTRVHVAWPDGQTRVLRDYPTGELTLYRNERLGDWNGDGRVDGVDFDALARCLGSPVAPGCEMLDVDGDGVIGAGDTYLMWARADRLR